MRIFIVILNCIILVIFYLLWGYYDHFLKPDNLSKLFEINLSTSTILFGVLGIWISSVYGTNISSIYSQGLDKNTEALSDINFLINPLLFSVSNIFICLLFFLFKSILTSIYIDWLDKVFLLKLSTYISYYLILCLGWFIFKAFAPFFKLRFEVQKLISKANLFDDRLKVNEKKK